MDEDTIAIIALVGAVLWLVLFITYSWRRGELSMRYVESWWRWSTGPGAVRKLVGFGLPALVALIVLAGIFGGTEDPADGPTDDEIAAGIGGADTAPTASASGAINVTISVNTPTPAAAGSADGKAYADAMSPIVSLYGEAMGSLGEHMGLIGETPALVFDEEWRSDAAVYVGVLWALADQARAVQPPACAAQAHASLIAAMDEYDRALRLTTEALDSFDFSQTGTMQTHMATGNALMTDAATQISGDPCR